MKNFHLIYIVFLTMFFCLSLIGQQSRVDEITVGEETLREYRLFTPSGDLLDKIPLVLNFHGFGSNAIQQEIYSGMNVIAETEKFLVAYPEGLLNSWNVGWTFGTMSDDVAFISALIDELIETKGVDPDRVYATGMSNGGFFSYRLACELNDKVAAVASVTGSMVPSYIPLCDPERPVPVLQIHGTQDETVPYDGSGPITIAIDTLMAFWADQNGCDPDPTIEDIPDINLEDGSTVEKQYYEDCEDESEVLLYRVFDGAHTWPGAGIILGVTNQDISATLEIWDFFKRHTLQSSLISNTDHHPVSKVDISPNPITDFMLVEGHGDEYYRVFGIDGTIVKSGRIANQSYRLDMSGLADGMYQLLITSADRSYSAKVIKHR